MRTGFINIILLLFIIFSCENTLASWLINGAEYHASAHGRLSCSDCHSDVYDNPGHPSSDNINRETESFFNAGKCTACHDVSDDIESGTHGSLKNSNELLSAPCISCHDPHKVKSFSENGDSGENKNLDISNCSGCHETRSQLPQSSPEDSGCMKCHFVSGNNPESNIRELCSSCHQENALYTGDSSPAVKFTFTGPEKHQDISCAECHKNAVQFGHSNQDRAECRSCHVKDFRNINHNTHINMSCEACHLKNFIPVREKGSIFFKKDPDLNKEYDPHKMVTEKSDMCIRCHHTDNRLGASEHILPHKGIICLPCHTASASVPDTVSIWAVIVFLAGVSGSVMIWFMAGRPGKKGNGITFNGLIRIIYSLAVDGIFQRRLLKVSVKRWIIHSMILFPFVFRFAWGISALVMTAVNPECDFLSILLDKNRPFTGFVFDLSGLLILAGGILMMLEKRKNRIRYNLKNLPGTNPVIYLLMGGMLLSGFIVEGAGIAMAGNVEGAAYAFAGFALSRLLVYCNPAETYVYLWYTHAVFTGLFIAFLPFSRMFHVLLAPLSLALRAAAKE